MMIEIKKVMDKNKKTEITSKIMNDLPLWFSPPEDIEEKSIVHRDFHFFAAYDDNEVVGFLALKVHNEYTADIYNLGVLERYHRQGIGHQLINECINYCKDKGYIYLTVKTLDSSAEYEPYERTRKFYFKEGFIPLEVFTTVWNEENPCLFLVKKI